MDNAIDPPKENETSEDPAAADGEAAPGSALTSVPSAGDILAELPKSIYGGFDALALPNGVDESEKMLLFPESVIKAAVDTLKEVHLRQPQGWLRRQAQRVRARATRRPSPRVPPSAALKLTHARASLP